MTSQGAHRTANPHAHTRTLSTRVARCVDERVVEVEDEHEAPAGPEPRPALTVHARSLRRRHAQPEAVGAAVEPHAATTVAVCAVTTVGAVGARRARYSTAAATRVPTAPGGTGGFL